ncbi:MAG: SGNH/GDSL hydrolase family protein [Planctomycetota bacterium]|nr:SGNH/GDSL hydrolase family protein [Planctomycetota bacterium]MDA1177250.1 SGNH/GDSL hydrolase family protein [Planctomycetota bacterium]
MPDNCDAENDLSGRREFIRRTTGIFVGGATVGSTVALLPATKAEAADKGLTAETRSLPEKSLIRPGDTILFQGDSITDASRSRDAQNQENAQAQMGSGYAWLAASSLLVDYPAANLKIYNRGISGNKVFQLNERWKVDCVDLQPDVLSILIGVNDYWHNKVGDYKGTIETYATDYRKLLERTHKELPDVKLVLCEPFLAVCGNVDATWLPTFQEFSEVAHKLAEEFHATWVPFHAMIQRASQVALPEVWAKDGVHPSADGASLMAHTWLRAVGE